MVTPGLTSSGVGAIPGFVSTEIWYTFRLGTQRLRTRTAEYVGREGIER